jgi:AraC family transcriptional regulator of adaptative response / DNA-3-methyladenine glycosylase II
VTSTGIYCRPVCRVRLPKRENCRFFEHAVQAEQAGFRPCLRCRPELAPLERHWSLEDAGQILTQQACRWLDDPHHWPRLEEGSATLVRLSQRLGVSDRHLRRLFAEQLGVSPLQYLQTRKLLTAKQLLADTAMPISQVAWSSGFASLRRFNAAFAGHYGLQPGQMRRQGAAAHAGGGEVRLSWRPPLDAQALMDFLAQRQLPGVEQIEGLVLRRSARLHVAGQAHSGWFRAELEPDAHRLRLWVSTGLLPVLPNLIWRVRALFDLDADPSSINAALAADFPGGDGLRVPGTFDGFELAVRAILGQQITVAAARTLARRLCLRLGEPLALDTPGLDRLFPTPEALAGADPGVLGELGIVRQRQTALIALSRAVVDGTLDLSPHADLAHNTTALLALPGVGPWTAQYIAMRALRWPDAWPVGDVAVLKALGLERGRPAQQQADTMSLAWRPWRSYAVIRAWAGHHRRQPSKIEEFLP